MVTSLLFWVGILVETTIIARGLYRGLFLRYPTFFTYLCWVTFSDSARFYVYRYHWNLYQGIYWPSQFISLVLGYGVIVEILELTLAHYPGAARFARNLVILIFALIFAYVTFRAIESPLWTPASTNAELERDLRAAQVLVLAGILSVVKYFRIPLGRNLKGMIGGYGLFLASSVITLAMKSYAGSSFDRAWLYIQPGIFLICLLIWVCSMWSYRPCPAAGVDKEALDYKEYAASTQATLAALRSNLGKVVRS